MNMKTETWKPIKTLKPNRFMTEIDLWVSVPNGPLSMGMGGQWRVADCWTAGDGKFWHSYFGSPKEIDRNYVTHWMRIPKPPKKERR